MLPASSCKSAPIPVARHSSQASNLINSSLQATWHLNQINFVSNWPAHPRSHVISPSESVYMQDFVESHIKITSASINPLDYLFKKLNLIWKPPLPIHKATLTIPNQSLTWFISTGFLSQEFVFRNMHCFDNVHWVFFCTLSITTKNYFVYILFSW